MKNKFSHFDESGRPRMVDVTDKNATERYAEARGVVRFARPTFNQIVDRPSKKGDIISIAELAGVIGAKKTADLIPLCHPLPLTGVDIAIEQDHERCTLIVSARVKTNAKTGVEMEALTAVATACLTIYDMAKAVDKSMVIEKIELIKKTGGSSGDFQRKHVSSDPC